MTRNKKKVLILFAHPAQRRSEVNLPLFEASRTLENVTTIDLYHEYPTFSIDIDKEQQRLKAHDVIVFMFPMYWYSTPALLKEWQDLVLEYGFAYGSDGDKLHGKWFMCALTAGGGKDAYCSQGYNNFSINQLLRPLQQTANLTGMEFLPPFILYGSRSAVEENRIAQHIEDWKAVVAAIEDGSLNPKTSASFHSSNAALSALTGDK